jgi:hypothetical protein
LLRDPKIPWNPGPQRGNLIEELRLSNLNNSSPIISAVELAMIQGFPKQYDGPKVVLVLTDGADNLSFGAGARVGNYTDPKMVRDRLDKLHKMYGDVSLMTVCFQQLDSDNKDSKEEYEAATEQFKDKAERPNRLFKMVDEGGALAGEIKELLRPRLEFTARNVGTGKEVYRQLDIYRFGDQIDWKDFRVDTYDTKVVGGVKSFGEFSFLSGRNMLLTLQRNGKFVLGRGLIAKQEDVAGRLPSQLIKPDRDWFATLYESDRHKGKLKQLLLLEQAPDRPGPVEQPRPEMVWLEVAPTDKSGDDWGPVRWHDDWRAAAPAYRLLVDQWSTKRPAKLNAYWQEDFPTHAAVSRRVMANEEKQTIKVGKTWFEIENIDRATMPGSKEKALVVRIKHDPDHKVWLHLKRWGGKNQSAEFKGGWGKNQRHEYYSKVGSYTAYFYPWLDLEYDNAEFLAVCVSSFKDDQERRRHAEFDVQQDYSIPAADFFHGSRIAPPTRPEDLP